MSNDTVNDTKSKITNGLGSLVWWDLHGTKIRPDALRKIIEDAGEDASIVPDIKTTKALRAAVATWSQGRGKAERFRAEVVSYDKAGNTMTIGILKRVRHGPKTVGWDQVDKGVYMLSTASILQAGVTDEWHSFHEVAKEKLTFLDHAWIRPGLIQARLARWSSFSLRRQGGVYYIPNLWTSEVTVLQTIISQIGSSTLHRLHVEDTADGRASLQKEANKHLVGAISEVRAKIDAWGERSNKLRKSSFILAMKEFKQLKDQANLYAEVLSCEVSSLLAEVDEGEIRVKEMIDEVVGVEETAPRNPVPRNGHAVPSRYRQATLDKVAEAIASGDHYEDGSMSLTASQIEEAGLSVWTWVKIPCRWAPGGHAHGAALAVGWEASLQKSPFLVTFTRAKGLDSEDPTNELVESDESVDLDPTPEKEADNSTPETFVEKYTFDDLTETKTSELSIICREMGVKSPGKLKKTGKVEAILLIQEAHRESFGLFVKLEAIPEGTRIKFQVGSYLQIEHEYEKNSCGWTGIVSENESTSRELARVHSDEEFTIVPTSS